MPAKSKKQQRFFGMVHAYQKGDLKNPSASIKKAAKSIRYDDVKHFAETKHKGLPEKVKKTRKKKTYENIITFSEYLLNEGLITLSGRVNVPERNIVDKIESLNNWFAAHQDEDHCYVNMFGHNDWRVNSETVEKDVRDAARLATTNEKKLNEYFNASGPMNISEYKEPLIEEDKKLSPDEIFKKFSNYKLWTKKDYPSEYKGHIVDKEWYLRVLIIYIEFLIGKIYGLSSHFEGNSFIIYGDKGWIKYRDNKIIWNDIKRWELNDNFISKYLEILSKLYPNNKITKYDIINSSKN